MKLKVAVPLKVNEYWVEFNLPAYNQSPTVYV